MANTGSTNQTTGEIYDEKDWILSEFHRPLRRLSDKQLAFISGLEYQLGYKPKDHKNLPAYKAVVLIERLKARLEAREHGN